MDYAKLAVELQLKNSQYLAQLSKAQGKTNQFAGGMKSVFAGLGRYMAGAAVLGVFYKIAQATDEQMKAEAQLEAVLKSTGHAAGVTAEEIKGMAAALQQQTTYGDEAIIQGQNLLLTFTNIKKDAFEPATKAMLDMATAMGTDLKSAAIQIGKALNDPEKGITALTRSGITFSRQQEEQIKLFSKTGQAAKAQSMILRELERQFGGSAAAATRTFSGAMTQLKNTIGDNAELIGMKMAPGLSLFAKTLGEALTNGQGLHTTLENLGEVGASSFARLAVTVATVNVLLTRAATGWDRVFNKGGKGTALWAQNQEQIAKAEATMYKALNEWEKLEQEQDNPTEKKKESTAAIKANTAATEENTRAKKEARKAEKELEQTEQERKRGIADVTNAALAGAGQIMSGVSSLMDQMAQNATRAFESLNSNLQVVLEAQYEQQLEAYGLQEETRSEALEAEIEELELQVSKTRNLKKRKALQEQIDQKKQEKQKYELQEEYERKKNKLEIIMDALRMQLQRRQFERNKQYQLAQVWVNTAAAITAAWLAAWTMGFPPLAIAMGAISTALLLANAGIQTGVIARQQAPAFAQGAWDLPADTPAQLHKNELVMPAPFAEDFRSAIQGGGTEEIHVHLHLDGDQIHEAVVKRENRMAKLLGAKSRFQFGGAYA